ncbi:MAG: sulfur carrier protein ThiS [bacterium]|jgi:sulfur carrier protein
MKIIVNGNTHELNRMASLDDLLKQLGANPEAVALMVNDQVIPRTERAGMVLKEGDRLEVLSFMGGG